MNRREILIDIFKKQNGLLVEDGEYNYWEFDDPQKVLETVVAFGNNFEFVFHGTTVKIEGKVVPQQALDMLREQGRRSAVYATNNVSWAMFWSLTGGTKLMARKRANGRMLIRENKKIEYENTSFVIEDEVQMKDLGWVYIFENSDWEYSKGEYLSYETKDYLAVVKIRKEDFKFPVEIKEIPRITYQNN